MTYKVDVHLALFRNTEIKCYPSVIAVLKWLFVLFEFSVREFSCCDYKASCQSHMRQYVKNVHEGSYLILVARISSSASVKKID